MTTDPAAAAAARSGVPPLPAVQAGAGPVRAPFQHDGGQPSGLVEPQVLYATTAQAAASPVVSQRLDERLRDEVLQRIGAVSNALELAVVAALRGVHWRDTRQRTAANVVGAVLTQVAADPHLESEASTVRARILAAPSGPVADVLGLDTPLVDNSAVHADVTSGLVVELAHLADLSDVATQAVTQHSAALVNSSAATLDALVAQGRLTRQEEASLTTNLELAKLTHDNLVLIRALLAAGVTSPLTLVGWTPDQWHQLLAGQQVPVPPGETRTPTPR